MTVCNSERQYSATLIDGNRQQKPVCLNKQTRYHSMNKVERLFNRGMIFMTDLRKSMTPQHLELLMFLRMDCRIWSEMTVVLSAAKQLM